mgnify:CR=1 FL=1
MKHHKLLTKRSILIILLLCSWSDYLTGGQLLLLLAILLLGILVRVVGIANAPRGFNQDEASAGYDAFAILKYGIDRNGMHNPVHLIAWGSGQNAAYSWLCMPFIALLGLSVWSVRLPWLWWAACLW